MEMPVKLTGVQPHITVLMSDTFGDEYKPFHCVSCGNVVFSYNNDRVRTILPSGQPKLDKAGQAFQCHGVMKLRSTVRIYDVLYEVLETAMQTQDLNELRTAVAYIARDAQIETNARCKSIYYVS